ncbi:hypothetical protein CCAX7_49560 [Capsulimonas corticalis]|uniref:Uncharacterized protein n=1 Tax=Capsulimonas corticalis TaxID=2219043 RepID=A0A402CPS0_9BACT|nr:hypothetical protein [Capsulimonas corticalis]BDI32905.1 hypothetical protein CCAX7_49560 [Capsulimonas corticalis]
MPKLPWNSAPSAASGVLGFWKQLKSLSASEIMREAERPFQIALIGPPDHTALLAARLALEMPTPTDSAAGPANIWPYVTMRTDAREAPQDAILLHADPLTADETRLAEALAQIVSARPEIRLSLARHIPAFRPAVVSQVIADASWDNAKIAVVSALPGIIPFTDILLPATALGDTILLTRNQAVLLMRIAAAYGQQAELKERYRELLPVFGSAFGWRTLARELVGLVPGGVGVVVKGAIAYAGTYTVGKTAAIYFSTGKKLTASRMKQLYQDAYRSAVEKVRGLLRRAPSVVSAKETSAGVSEITERPQPEIAPSDYYFEDSLDNPAKIGV